MLVSILIPAYNAGLWIRETIASALAQTWPGKEIIVVDDGSTDDTLPIARSFERSGAKVLTGPNRGASAARNRAFAESSGDYIQYLDADDLLAPDKIERQMQDLKARAGYDPTIVSASAWAAFTGGVEDARAEPTALWKDWDDPVAWIAAAWTSELFMQPGAWLTPRALAKAAGPWNEELSFNDDGEAFARVLLQSSRILFCPEAVAYYRKGIATSLSTVRSPRAVASHLRACGLDEAHLLAREDSPRTRAAAAAHWTHFHYDYYPLHPESRRTALAAARRLGGSRMKAQGSSLFMRLSKLFGWKAARHLERFAMKHGLNPAALKQRVRR